MSRVHIPGGSGDALEVARIWAYRDRKDENYIVYRFDGSARQWGPHDRVSAKPSYGIVYKNDVHSPANPIQVFPKYKEAKLALRLIS